MKSRVLVTGGAGFIGSHLCEELLSRGYDVTCLDNFSTGSHENIKHLGGLKVIEGDVNNKTTWTRMKGRVFDGVFHYAAFVGVRRTEENPLRVMKDADGLRYLTQFAQHGGARKVLFSSSSEVYGEPDVIPTREEHGSIAWSPYTAVKMYGEHLLRSLWEEDGIPTVVFRFFNVYGTRQVGNGYGFVTATFVKQAVRGEAPTIYGDGLQSRDFVCVSDNVRATIAAFESDGANGEVINIGTGRETQIRELASMVIRTAGKKKQLQPVHLPARKIEIMRRCASTEKMQRILHISCTTTLEEGVANIYEAEKHTIKHLVAQPALNPT